VWVDDILRWSVLGVLGFAALLALLGGLVTPVAGRFRDGQRLITLHQIGPWLVGRCEREGGFERYRGWAFFGVVRLSRYEYGAAHLQASGFAPDTAPLVEGERLASFVFRAKPHGLVGMFEGRKVSFTSGPKATKVSAIEKLPPAPRTWLREENP
jgi:hypothetical protein